MWGMDSHEHPDWALITSLGGAAKVAELLGYTKAGGVQRVQNWKARGIPPGVKLRHPELFLPDMKRWDGKDRRKTAKAL